jgi:hypothetical protein
MDKKKNSLTYQIKIRVRAISYPLSILLLIILQSIVLLIIFHFFITKYIIIFY